jgi:hypothetical protein
VGVPQSRTVRSCGQLAAFVVDIKFLPHESNENSRKFTLTHQALLRLRSKMYDEMRGGVGVSQSRTVRSYGQFASFVVDIKFLSHESDGK